MVAVHCHTVYCYTVHCHVGQRRGEANAISPRSLTRYWPVLPVPGFQKVAAKPNGFSPGTAGTARVPGVQKVANSLMLFHARPFHTTAAI